MKKSLELYFVIYLGAIISFLAIEGELKVYKDNQRDILKKVAEEKAQSLVHVKRKDDSDGKNINIKFKIEGDFEFITQSDSIKFINPTDTVSVPLVANATKGTEFPFYASADKNIFTNKDELYDVLLCLSVAPKISERTRLQWAIDYGDIKIANKLIELIQSMEKIEVTRAIAYSVKPKIGEISPFVLNGENALAAIKGIKWKHEIYPGGVANETDYDVRVTNGVGVDINKIGTDKIIVTGTSYANSSITVRGKRNLDQSTDSFTFDVNVVEPRWENDPPGPSEVCLNEDFVLYCGLKKVDDPSRISVYLSGDYYAKPQLIQNTVVNIEGKQNAGVIRADVHLDNSKNAVMRYSIRVVKPSEPVVTLEKRDDCNDITYKISALCSGNRITGLYPKNGIKSSEFLKEEDLDGRVNAFYKIRIKKPRGGKTQQQIEFMVEDSHGNKTIHKETVGYRLDSDCD